MRIELIIVLAAFALGGVVIGVSFRWRLVRLLTTCAVLGFALSLVMRDWSDFDLSTIVADAGAGGSSWVSWVVEFTTLFILFAIPMGAGGAIGFALWLTKAGPLRR
jgi:hypothetical protein